MIHTRYYDYDGTVIESTHNVDFSSSETVFARYLHSVAVFKIAQNKLKPLSLIQWRSELHSMVFAALNSLDSSDLSEVLREINKEFFS